MGARATSPAHLSLSPVALWLHGFLGFIAYWKVVVQRATPIAIFPLAIPAEKQSTDMPRGAETKSRRADRSE